VERSFDVVIERDEEGLYVASVPSLPGCHTQAPSLDDLMNRVKEAIELCLEVEGLPSTKLEFGVCSESLLLHEYVAPRYGQAAHRNAWARGLQRGADQGQSSFLTTSRRTHNGCPGSCGRPSVPACLRRSYVTLILGRSN